MITWKTFLLTVSTTPFTEYKENPYKATA